jgi:hypothetical protein
MVQLLKKLLTTTKAVTAMLLIIIALSACKFEHQAPNVQPQTYSVPQKAPANNIQQAPVKEQITHEQMEEMRRQNRQLQQRSRFTSGGVVMILGIIGFLVFLSASNRWRHTLEVKNRQLERERNVVVAQNKQLSI